MTGAPLTVFLDRDGTINLEKKYLHRIRDFEFIPGAPEALAQLTAAGATLIVVTNQAGIGRGYYTVEDVQRLHEFVEQELAKVGARIDGWYTSPFHPEASVPEYRGDSACRKPNPGMFEQAIADLNLPEDGRYVVGDKLLDLQAGAKVNCTTVLVRTGYGAEHLTWPEAKTTRIDHVADALPDAVAWILEQQR